MIFLLIGYLGCGNDSQGVQVFNSPPDAKILSHTEGELVLENYTLQFRGTATDPNHDSAELTVTWRTASRILCEPILANADGTTQCDTSLGLEEENISLEVQDPEGVIRSDDVTLDVIPSGPPEGSILSPEPLGKYYSDVEIIFTAVVSDAEADPEDLRVYWESDLDGSLTLASSPDTDGTLEDSSFLSEGQHQLTMAVEDPQGNQSFEAVNITVGGQNEIPSCNIVEPLDGATSEFGTLVLFRGQGSDPDVPPNELFAEWSSNIDGVLGFDSPSSNGEVAYGTEALSGGVHTISLSVSDETGATCTDFILHTISVPPEISIGSPNINDIFSTDDTITFSALVSDNEDASTLLEVQWSSDLDGEFASSFGDSSGNTINNYDNLSAGVHIITATVTDSDALSTSKITSIEVTDCSQNYWFLDTDGDLYGDSTAIYTGCNPPAGYVNDGGDCDDNDSSQNPDADEYCNSEDDNCDGAIDENSAVDVNTWYQDLDGDLYGDPLTLVIACDAPDTTYVNQGDDCNDSSNSINPDVIEVCEDGIDNDCSNGDLSCQLELSLNGADASMFGHFSYDFAGWSVSAKGDLDNDGFDDIVIGAHGNDVYSNSSGMIYVLSGNPSGILSLPTSSVARLHGENIRDYAGYDVSIIPDINGDQNDDILIGAYGFDKEALPNDVPDVGIVYLVHGPVSGDISLETADAMFIGEEDEDYAGWAVSGGADVSGDGSADDVIIGAYNADDNGRNGAGIVYLVHGPHSGEIDLTNADARLIGENNFDFAGYDVDFADLNADGFDDILIGAYGQDGGGNASGGAYVIQGPITGDLDIQFADGKFKGEGSFHFAGQSISSAGDFDGDGKDDLLIGATGEDSQATAAGSAYVVFGPAETIATDDLSGADVKFVGTNDFSYAGWSVSSCADINGDLAWDLLIGAPEDDTSGQRSGAVYVVFGPEYGTIGLQNTYAKWTGNGQDHSAGASVSCGDINGDGLSDLLFGAPGETSSGTETGAAYMVLGSSSW